VTGQAKRRKEAGDYPEKTDKPEPSTSLTAQRNTCPNCLATRSAAYVFFQLQRHVTSPDRDHSFDRMLRIALPDGSDLEYPEAIERAQSGPWDPKVIIHVADFGVLRVEMHPNGRTVLKELGEPVLIVTPEPKENKHLGDVLKKGNWMLQLACIREALDKKLGPLNEDLIPDAVEHVH